MKVLKIVLMIILAIVILFLVVAAFMPSSYHIERSIDINQPVELVFEQVADLNNFEQWSPWNEMEPSAYSPVEGMGVGQVSKWDGDTVGKGALTVTGITEYESLTQSLKFEEPFEGAAEITFTFVQNENGTIKVTWSTIGELGYPVARFLKPMIESELAESFDKGLAKLKERCEAIKDYVKIEVTNFPGGKYYTISDKCHVSEIEGKMNKIFPELYAFVGKNQLQFAGNPITINNEYDMELKIWDFTVAVPVTDNSKKATGKIKAMELPPMKVAKTVYVGPYDGSEKTYMAMEVNMKKRGYEVAGKSIEEYVNSPEDTPPNELITNIYYPIK
jgi:effector-binding domain-containing protein